MNEQEDELIVYRWWLRHCHVLLVCVYQNTRQYQGLLLLLENNFGMSCRNRVTPSAEIRPKRMVPCVEYENILVNGLPENETLTLCSFGTI